MKRAVTVHRAGGRSGDDRSECPAASVLVSAIKKSSTPAAAGAVHPTKTCLTGCRPFAVIHDSRQRDALIAHGAGPPNEYKISGLAAVVGNATESSNTAAIAALGLRS